MTIARERMMLDTTLEFYRGLVDKLEKLNRAFDDGDYEQARTIHESIMREHKLQMTIVAEGPQWANARATMINLPVQQIEAPIVRQTVVAATVKMPPHGTFQDLGELLYRQYYVEDAPSGKSKVVDVETRQPIAEFEHEAMAEDYVQMLELRSSQHLLKEWNRVFEDQMHAIGDVEQARKVADDAVRGLMSNACASSIKS